LQKFVRNLDQDARAIAGLFVAAGRATMQQVLQNPDTAHNDFMGSGPIDIGDKPHTTGVVFILRVV